MRGPKDWRERAVLGLLIAVTVVGVAIGLFMIHAGFSKLSSEDKDWILIILNSFQQW